MRSWTEKFGRFYTNSTSWDAKKRIFWGYDDSTTSEEMVRNAIALAKMYNCKIVEKVTFTSALVGGSVSFVVECHSLTHQSFYEGGKLVTPRNSEVKEADIKKYEEKFGTRKCEEKGYKKQYWFTDNWNGQILYFSSLKAAKEAERQQTGNSCCIHETQPYGRGSKIVCFVDASGFAPP